MKVATKNTKPTKLAGATKTEKVVKKKKSLLEIAKELAQKPLFTIKEKDRELIYGSNMMTKLMQE